jgi:hypothetical protein
MTKDSTSGNKAQITLKNPKKAHFPHIHNEAAPFNKLAQLPPENRKASKKAPLYKRAKAKYYTHRIVGPMCWLDSPCHKTYQFAYHCCNQLIQTENKVKGKYCNSRICNVCSRIRTAKLMNGYYEPLKKLGKLEFTTLTRRNVSGNILRETINEMQKKLTLILRNIREKKKIDFSGIIKLECTYNSERDDYHPHFHILTNKDIGNLIINEWLKRYDKEIVNRLAQHVVIANDNSTKEMFKYVTKFLEKDNGEESKEPTLNIYVSALDTIMVALRNKRTFQAIGSLRKLKVKEEVEDLEVQENLEIAFEEIKHWNYDYTKNDWVHLGERLTLYEPPETIFQIFI